MQQHRSEINAILSPEQQQLMQQMHGRHHSKGTAHMQGCGKAIIQQLNLTETQQEKLRSEPGPQEQVAGTEQQ